MKADDQDQLWHLLGKAKRPRVSPFFARDVLRAVRADADKRREKSEPLAWMRWLRWTWRSALAGTCAAVVFGVAVHSFVKRSGQDDSPMLLAQQIATNPDYDVISDLDELMAT